MKFIFYKSNHRIQKQTPNRRVAWWGVELWNLFFTRVITGYKSKHRIKELPGEEWNYEKKIVSVSQPLESFPGLLIWVWACENKWPKTPQTWPSNPPLPASPKWPLPGFPKSDVEPLRPAGLAGPWPDPSGTPNFMFWNPEKFPRQNHSKFVRYQLFLAGGGGGHVRPKSSRTTFFEKVRTYQAKRTLNRGSTSDWVPVQRPIGWDASWFWAGFGPIDAPWVSPIVLPRGRRTEESFFWLYSRGP